jgi:hypothetical protein
MYRPEEMEGTTVLATIRLMKKHRATWREKPDWFWYWHLILEVVELGLALAGQHKDPAEWELMQIAAIAMNFKDKRELMP